MPPVLYTVEFRHALGDVPAEIRGRLRRSLEEIAHVMDAIPPSSDIVVSMVKSPMHLDVNGWAVPAIPVSNMFPRLRRKGGVTRERPGRTSAQRTCWFNR